MSKVSKNDSIHQQEPSNEAIEAIFRGVMGNEAFETMMDNIESNIKEKYRIKLTEEARIRKKLNRIMNPDSADEG